MKKKKVQVAIAFAVVAVVLTWLVVSGFNENMQYYVSIEELKSQTVNWDKGLRVKGKLVSGSLIQTQKTLENTFRIHEEAAELEVRYNGLLPDTFKDGADVLVEGTYSPEGYFVAKTVMAKCPSKYEESDSYNKLPGSEQPDSPADGTD